MLLGVNMALLVISVSGAVLNVFHVALFLVFCGVASVARFDVLGVAFFPVFCVVHGVIFGVTLFVVVGLTLLAVGSLVNSFVHSLVVCVALLTIPVGDAPHAQCVQQDHQFGDGPHAGWIPQLPM